MEVNGDQQLFGYQHSLKYLLFVLKRRKKLMQTWNTVMVSKWWQNLHFWVNYPFKSPCMHNGNKTFQISWNAEQSRGINKCHRTHWGERTWDTSLPLKQLRNTTEALAAVLNESRGDVLVETDPLGHVPPSSVLHMNKALVWPLSQSPCLTYIKRTECTDDYKDKEVGYWIIEHITPLFIYFLCLFREFTL